MAAQRDFPRSKVLLSFVETPAFLQAESFYPLQCCNAAALQHCNGFLGNKTKNL